MICNCCDKEMLKVDSCIENDIEYPDGIKIKQSTFYFNEDSGRCHDCNIKHGNFHHSGCDVERCPRCQGQLISCGCLNEKEK